MCCINSDNGAFTGMQMFTEINVQTVEPDESCQGKKKEICEVLGGQVSRQLWTGRENYSAKRLKHKQQVYNSKLHELAAQPQNEVEADEHRYSQHECHYWADV